MKNTLTVIEEIKMAHHFCEYVDGNIVNEDGDIKEQNIDDYIYQYYDDSEITVSHPSGNPELETFERVDGRTYIKQQFNGSLEDAYNEIEVKI